MPATNTNIHHNMVCMTEHEYKCMQNNAEISRKSAILSEQRVKHVEKLLADSTARVKLLEDTLRATESELKQLRVEKAANELTEEAQRLGLYDIGPCDRYNDPAG